MSISANMLELSFNSTLDSSVEAKQSCEGSGSTKEKKKKKKTATTTVKAITAKQQTSNKK